MARVQRDPVNCGIAASGFAVGIVAGVFGLHWWQTLVMSLVAAMAFAVGGLVCIVVNESGAKPGEE